MKYFILLSVLLAGCSESPKFKVGDCIQAQYYNPESWYPPTPIEKIVEVGNNAYRTEIYRNGVFNAVNKVLGTVFFSDNYIKVACPREKS